MTAITNTLSYWLNWRFLVCSLFLLAYLALATTLICKFEGRRRSRNQDRENQEVAPGVIYEEEAWSTCFKCIHPAWLLAFRMFAFITLLTLLVINVIVDGIGIFIFYTQWTFTLVTIYFLFGSAISIYGCKKIWAQARGDSPDHVSSDIEQGTEITPPPGETTVESNESQHFDDRKIAGPWIYTFQIIYQASAVAAVLTDLVFWIILFPFITSRYGLELMLVICMHSVNVVFLLGDTILNCLRLPFFRIAYFFLWTCIYVLFQWVLHAYSNIPWPYPFLDLTPAYAPLWYLGVGMMHLPAYGIYALAVRLKEVIYSRLFPESYRKFT
uniref:Uncharacterized protein n=2 Tax=Gossypium raimondii TaxID=29730 RepID=A0A0D2RNH9_GOSRA|nr:hypothetical protein B456_005G180900 [Gossypium raimondii]